MVSKTFTIRQKTDLPFYCRPLWLFFSVWFMMLGSFELNISYTTYPDISIALLIFFCSVVPFLLGNATLRLAFLAVGYVPKGPSEYRIDLAKVRRFQWILLATASVVILYNLVVYGLPPIFGFFGFDVLDYQKYGGLKQILFVAFMAIFVTAPLETSRIRRYFFYAFALSCALAYVTRGYLLIMIFQLLVVYSLRTNVSKKKIYIVALSTFCSAIIISGILGNNRNSLGSDVLLRFMQIRREYYDWNPALLWMISYVSTPISNMCWIVQVYRYDHPTGSFLYYLLPGFLNPAPTIQPDLGSGSIVDGVHTYLAEYYFNFLWFGVLGINYIWGLISGYMNAGNRLPRNYLVSAVLLGCMAFMFFFDFLTILIIVLELVVLGLGHRYFTLEGRGLDKL
jgi:hypothetical protein